MNNANHHDQDPQQDHNGFLDLVNYDQNTYAINIEYNLMNPFDKFDVKFGRIKFPSNEIQDSEVNNDVYCKSLDYENTDGEILNSDNDIEPLSLFADDKSVVDSVLALNHGIDNDTYSPSKHFIAKNICIDSGEVADSKLKLCQAENDPMHNQAINQYEKANEPVKKTMKAVPGEKELSAKLKRFRMFGYSRWGRKEDCEMFSMLRQLCKQDSVDIEDFYTNHSNLSTQHNFILKNLSFEMNWRSDTHCLLKRIQSLGRDQTLSVRQIYMLKRFKRKAKQQKKEFILMDVIDSFPGKSISTLQSALEQHPSIH